MFEWQGKKKMRKKQRGETSSRKQQKKNMQLMGKYLKIYINKCSKEFNTISFHNKVERQKIKKSNKNTLYFSEMSKIDFLAVVLFNVRCTKSKFTQIYELA